MISKRLALYCSLITVLLITAPPALAQQAKKVFRIGYLSNADPATDSARVEGIRLALRKLGYIEGQNIAIEYRYAEERPDRAPLSLRRRFFGRHKKSVNLQVTAVLDGPSNAAHQSDVCF
jgi:hypothetical protein